MILSFEIKIGIAGIDCWENNFLFYHEEAEADSLTEQLKASLKVQ